MKLSVNLMKNVTKIMADSKQQVKHLKEIFLCSVAAVEPAHLIRNSVRVQENSLYINNDRYQITKPIYVVGFGKAVYDMTVEVENILVDNFQEGVINVPVGITESSKVSTNNVRSLIVEGAMNNLPDENAEKGAKLIKNIVEKLEADDLLLVLISGGGSALLPLPKDPITLNEKLNISKSLAKRGATIQELNCVRKNISLLKGGGLAKLAYPAKVVSLILSDIIDDPLGYIASGPTIPNFDTANEAVKIIKKYSLYEQLPSSIKRVLETEFDDCEDITSNGTFIHVRNYIIGNNKIAANAALAKATSLGYQTFVLSTRVSGEVDRISKIYAELARQVASLINSGKTGRENLKVFLESLRAELNISESTIKEIINFNFNFCQGICLILAGEPTVVVKGNGRGGRNQELALRFSIEINKFDVESTNVSFLSCGTDGIDGPTDAAGALGTSNLVNNALEKDINPTLFLQDNDSYSFYSIYNDGEYLIRTGHTGTNVMDIHILIVSPKTQ